MVVLTSDTSKCSHVLPLQPCCSDPFFFLFFQTIQMDSFAFLCLLWVYLQAVGKVTPPKCSAWVSKGVAEQGVVCVHQHGCCSVAFWAVSEFSSVWAPFPRTDTLPWDWKPAIVWCNKQKASLYNGCISMAVSCLLNFGWKPIRRFQLNALWRIHLDKTKFMHAIEKHSSLHAKHIVPHSIKCFFFLPKTILHFNVTGKIASRYRANFSILKIQR